MPPTGKLEFPDARPRLYTFMLVVVGCICAIWVLVSSLIPRYWSFPIADKAHPDTIQLNGTVVHMSRISHWLFTGSFIAMLVGIVVLVGLGVYYRSVGIAVPTVREGMTRLNINSKR